ncbi:MAG: hypothetical protein U1F49_18510 [Rubrivivax sp.]
MLTRLIEEALVEQPALRVATARSPGRGRREAAGAALAAGATTPTSRSSLHRERAYPPSLAGKVEWNSSLRSARAGKWDLFGH